MSLPEESGFIDLITRLRESFLLELKLNVDHRFDKEKTEIILKLNTDLKDKIPSESSLNDELYIN